MENYWITMGKTPRKLIVLCPQNSDTPVKTYPTLSKKHIELVCTAGLTAEGKWIRLYPIPFRANSGFEGYKKFDWIECEVERNSKDFRSETFRPIDYHNIKKVGEIGTDNNWRARNEIVLGKSEVFTDLTELIRKAKKKEISLAVFKPKSILSFNCRPTRNIIDQAKIKFIREMLKENDLFEDNTWKRNYQLAKQLPHDYTYTFIDENDRSATLKILDWEIGALYWKVSNYGKNDTKISNEKVRQMYYDNFSDRDVYFFLGTTLSNQLRGSNPFTIVGVYYPPKPERTLFDNN